MFAYDKRGEGINRTSKMQKDLYEILYYSY